MGMIGAMAVKQYPAACGPRTAAAADRHEL